MPLFTRFKQGQLRLGRIEAFSDGVFAIIVTLLVLELKTPDLREHGKSAAELAHHLVELLPEFLSWLISFIIVAKFWLNHHHILNLAGHADYGMVWLNSLFLMFQSFVPFPTGLMGSYPENPLAVSFFGVIMAINTVMFMVLQSYIVRNLMKPEMVDAQDPHFVRKAFVGPLFYLLGAGVAWLYTPAAFVLYMITPLFYITPQQKSGVATASRRESEN